MKNARSHAVKTLSASLGIAALLALSACGGNEPAPAEEPQSSSTEAESAPASDDTATEETDETTDAAETDEASETEESEDAEESDDASDDGDDAASGEFNEIKASSDRGQDKDLGHSFEATGIAFGLKGEGDRAEAPGNNTYVGVKIKGSTGKKFYRGLNCTDFKLWTEGSERGGSSQSSTLNASMEENGLTPYERISAGESGEGWCGFYAENPTEDNLTLEYNRRAAKDSDGNTYPEVTQKLKITPQG